MTKNIVLIKNDFEETEKNLKIFKNTNNLIISLDYESHNQLQKLNVEHVSFEFYLDENDFKFIDEETFRITTSWYSDPVIQEILSFDNINFGWLVEPEFYFYLQSVIKDFLFLIKIKEKQNPVHKIIVTENLFEMCKSIFDDSQLQNLDSKDSNMQKAIFDVYAIKYNLGPIPLVFRLPSKYFFKLRNFYEKSFIPIYNKLFTKINKKSHSALLIDFNAAREDEFLKYLGKINLNVFLLNRRRSSIWNFKSFQTVKTSKSIPITYNQFLTDDDQKEIKYNISKMKTLLNSLFLKSELFDDIFSILGYSFWSSIDKYFRNFCIERFSEAFYEMIGSRKLLSEIQPDVILHFFGVALQEKIILHEAKKLNIRAMMVQHGTPHIFVPNWAVFNPISGTLPVYEEKMVVWGNVLRDYAINNGMNENDLIVSGSIRHDPYFVNDLSCEKNDIILVALMPYLIFRAEDHKISSYEKYEQSLRTLCSILKKINKKKVIKLHPVDLDFFSIRVVPIIREIDPSIQILVDADLTKLIPKAEVVITLGLTTFLMDANIYGKPTITLVYNHIEYLSKLSNGYSMLFENSDAKNFEEYLHKILTDKKTRNENIKSGKHFIDSYLVNHGNASEYLASKIFEELN